MKKWKDPIVEEIHRIRAKMAKDANYDMQTIYNTIKQHELENKDAVFISLPQTESENIENKKIIQEIKTDKEMKNPKAWVRQKAGKDT